MSQVEAHDVRGLARLLTEADAAFRAVEAEALEQLELRPWMLRVLEHLARSGPRSPSQLAADLGVKQPTVSGWIAELVGRGLMERVGDERDGRRATLRLTQAGTEVRGMASDLVRRRQLRLASTLDPIATADLISSLQRLIAGRGE